MPASQRTLVFGSVIVVFLVLKVFNSVNSYLFSCSGNIKKNQFLKLITWKGTVVNQTFLLHEGSLEIALTFPIS